jgi:hypothetical protein
MIEPSNDRTEPAIVRTLFENIRPCIGVTPSPGFYERVRSRIEQIEQQLIWVVFIYFRFPARLATSLLALSLAALGCVLATEWNTNERQATLNDETHAAIFSGADVQQQRNAMLIQFLAYRRPK